VELKIRPRLVGSLIDFLPPSALAILHTHTQEKKVPTLSFAVSMLPPTVNHAYIYTRYNARLSEEYKFFKVVVAQTVKLTNPLFKISHTACVMMLFESPRWITKKHTIREMDLDNRIKPMLDAIKESINSPDETNWELHAYKIASKREQTTVCIFDLGDVVNYHN
jgi:Holliday junction resolvase RusA-like endonuclease